jgi:hypothetical protein
VSRLRHLAGLLRGRSRPPEPVPVPAAEPLGGPDGPVQIVLSGSGRGAEKVVVAGRDVTAAVRGLQINATAGHRPQVVLDLGAFGGVESDLGEARVVVSPATRDVLLAGGWLPPPAPGETDEHATARELAQARARLDRLPTELDWAAAQADRADLRHVLARRDADLEQLRRRFLDAVATGRGVVTVLPDENLPGPDPVLQAQVAAAYAFADELAGYCSPHGVSARYADRLRQRLDQAAAPQTAGA